MATSHVTRPPFPKPQLYEAIATLNRDLGIVIDDFNRLREFHFSRLYIDAFIVKIEDLRAWANSEFLDRQHSRELSDWNHFGQLNRKFERRFIDPNDVLINARIRLEELASEEQDALSDARELRKRRRLEEKRLAPLTAKPSK